MPWQTPQFWEKLSWRSIILLPFSGLYYLIYCLLRRKKLVSYQSRLPVICIGNVVIGGAGKTPCAIAIAKFLKLNHYQPAFVSRGYGGSLSSGHAIEVNHQTHQASEVGDEPLMLAEHAPTYIASDRMLAVKAAERNPSVNVIIMDDGLQNETVKKDIALLMMHGEYGVGNGLLFPAGPLREPLGKALKRVQAVVVNGEPSDAMVEKLKPFSPFKAKLKPFTSSTPESDVSYVAFAGIAHPKRFFDMLETHHYQLRATHHFPDHHAYGSEELEIIMQEAATQHASVITTYKDWVRLPLAYRGKITYLPVELCFDQEEEISNWLITRLEQSRKA